MVVKVATFVLLFYCRGAMWDVKSGWDDRASKQQDAVQVDGLGYLKMIQAMERRLLDSKAEHRQKELM